MIELRTLKEHGRVKLSVYQLLCWQCPFTYVQTLESGQKNKTDNRYKWPQLDILQVISPFKTG